MIIKLSISFSKGIHSSFQTLESNTVPQTFLQWWECSVSTLSNSLATYACSHSALEMWFMETEFQILFDFNEFKFK